jgi:hypothetical protein
MEMSICVPMHNLIIHRCLWERHHHACSCTPLLWLSTSSIILDCPIWATIRSCCLQKDSRILVFIQNIKWIGHAGWLVSATLPVFVSLHVNVQHYQLIPVLRPQPWILLFWSLTCGCPQSSQIWLVHTTSKTCHSRVNNIYHCSRNVSRTKSWCY